MAYVVLARKWRPMTFENVIGQEHITKTLMNALKNQRIAHAYIFAGPRGVGKTTTARLLAKALNCEKQPVVDPCNDCPSCRSITNGNSMDVIEIDGASNRGIDEIRNLRENIRFSPASSKYKIYIIDEVHMLTKEAFNALLKTLEEPPAHAIFIFATTEIHKVPLTILSRCQRFDFKRISLPKIQEQLKNITKSEKIKVDDEALLLISRKAEGSMRDAESILDQMISFSEGKLTTELVRESLGLIHQDLFFEFTDLIQTRNTADVLKFAGKITSSGHDMLDFLQGLQEHFRNLLIVRSLEDTKLIDTTEELRSKYGQNASYYSEQDLIHYIQIISDSLNEIKFSSFPQLSLELLLLKIVHKPRDIDLEEIIAFLEKVKKNPEIQMVSPGSAAAESPNSAEPEKPPVPRSQAPAATVRENTSEQKPTGVTNQFSYLEKKISRIKTAEKVSQPKKNETASKNLDIPIEEVKKKWSAIVDQVRSNKIALGSFLQEGIPYAVEEDKLVLAYDRNAAFHQEHVEKNSQYIETILKDQFEWPLRLKFTAIDFKKEGIEKEPRTPEEILDDIKEKEPIIKKIIDLFDLEEKKD